MEVSLSGFFFEVFWMKRMECNDVADIAIKDGDAGWRAKGGAGGWEEGKRRGGK
jgi:hypothetical protein